jgi:ATP-dependent exoDNAse (exonuclease V) alpha subunit
MGEIINLSTPLAAGSAPMVRQLCPIPYPLNEEQLSAVDAMERFLKDDEDFIVLDGPAGSGKTYCIKELVNRTKGRMVFTAPTNKATKELRRSVTSDAYRPECRTIFSLLGLKLEANGELKELSEPEEPIDLSKYLAVVVDEGGMVNSRLWQYIRTTAADQGIKFIFMGDPAQIPPVGERESPIWKVENRISLAKVMRHDNQILQLATSIRKVVDHPAPPLSIQSNNAGGEGVWKMAQKDFMARVYEVAVVGGFSKPEHAKAIAWRNSTVETLNRSIRFALYGDEATERFWLPEDRIIMLQPAKDLEGHTIAHTDDEGVVTRVGEQWHPEYPEYKTWALSVTFDDNSTQVIRLIHPDSLQSWQREKERLAQEARYEPRKWKSFWAFIEAFHQARHAYAITGHRAQGSTYIQAFVDYKDILLNRTKYEAMRVLYVAVSRPKKELYLA